MQWRGRRQSAHVEDRRGIPGGRVSIGCGGLLVLAVLVCLGVDPMLLARLLDVEVSTAPQEEVEDEIGQFVAVVLADNEEVWARQLGSTFRPATLVLFERVVGSACGFQSSATGPFYCPLDERVYLDVTFFAELGRGLGAGGDFARAYVVAHEYGHHVQHLLGLDRRGRDSVAVELQADCFAGVWAHHAERAWGILEPGDVEEALNAAAAIGDDRLQMRSRGYVVPETFTHGTSQQRVAWLLEGLRTGSPEACDTDQVSSRR